MWVVLVFFLLNLGAGDGGCVVTNNNTLASKMRRFRQYGWNKRKTLFSGINSRLDELQAAILRIKLKKLNRDNLERNRQAQLYIDNLNLKNILLPNIRKDTFHSFHLFVIQCNKRKSLMEYLNSKKIIIALHYKTPIHLMPVISQKSKNYRKIIC